MKYIVWGAGHFGKIALRVLGKEKILYFVDRDESMIGESLGGIPIRSVNEIDKNSHNIILITPYDYENEIMTELEEKGIHQYLPFSEHPFGLDLEEEVDSIGYIKKSSPMGERIFIYGVNWFNIFLYDYFCSSGKDVAFFWDQQERGGVINVLRDEYRVVCNYDEMENADCIFAPEGIREIPPEKFIDIEAYVEKAYPVSNERIQKYENIHKGERCVIVATGPSLTISDLDRLHDKGIKCISVNRIYNLFDRTAWRPDYYAVEDYKMIEDLCDEIAGLELEHKFVNGRVDKYWKQEAAQSSISYKMIMQNCLSDRVGFSRHIDRFVYNGYTVTYVCLQLAVYMGFTEIYLLGVDFNYSSDVYAESNHFEGYQSHYKDIRLNPILYDRMLRAYGKAKKVAQSMGVHIYNATRGGKLEIFDRADIDRLLENTK